MTTARISNFDERNIDNTKVWAKLYENTYKLVHTL